MSAIKRKILQLLGSVLQQKQSSNKQNSFSLYYKQTNPQKGSDLAARASFYLNAPVKTIPVGSKIGFYINLYFDNNTKLIGDTSLLPDNYEQFFYNVDYDTNPNDGWVWHQILGKRISPAEEETILKNAEDRFFKALGSKTEFAKSYIFGTGPSLAFAEKSDFSDGFRIVCNTIVKDKELWHHVKPHLIVAGDAIYHYGHTAFATAFRTDLKARLKESPDTLFVYPYLFHPFIANDFKGFESQLIPMQIGNRQQIGSLKDNFRLPNLGNVLNLLLLPLGITFSKNVYLLGFDGRAPSDKLFWSNSGKHFYSEHFETITKSHPKFFEHYVPKDNPTKYVKDVHGDVLEDNLARLEGEGYTFEVMYPSWTPALSKRHKNIANA